MADLQKTPHWDGSRDEQLKSYHEDMKTVKTPMGIKELGIKDIKGGVRGDPPLKIPCTGICAQGARKPFSTLSTAIYLLYYMFYMRQDVDVLI